MRTGDIDDSIRLGRRIRHILMLQTTRIAKLRHTAAIEEVRVEYRPENELHSGCVGRGLFGLVPSRGVFRCCCRPFMMTR
jgi:hypothetical protein